MGACGSKAAINEERPTGFANIWHHVEPEIDSLKRQLDDEKITKREIEQRLMEIADQNIKLQEQLEENDHSCQISQIGDILNSVYDIEQMIGPEEKIDLENIDPDEADQLQIRVTRDEIRKRIKQAADELRDEVKNAALRSFQDNDIATNKQTKENIEFKYEFIVKLTQKFRAI